MKNHIIERAWTTESGLPAVAVICIRDDGSKSHRCGYVGCPKHSSWRQDCYYPDFAVHGGITWSESKLPFEHETQAEHWLGFDCLHYRDSDIEPYIATGRRLFPDGEIRDLPYVISNCESLAKQICQSKQAPES